MEGAAINEKTKSIKVLSKEELQKLADIVDKNIEKKLDITDHWKSHIGQRKQELNQASRDAGEFLETDENEVSVKKKKKFY